MSDLSLRVAIDSHKDVRKLNICKTKLVQMVILEQADYEKKKKRLSFFLAGTTVLDNCEWCRSVCFLLAAFFDKV